MDDTLFPAAASLLSSAGEQQQQQEKTNQQPAQTMAENGRQADDGLQQQKLAQLKAQLDHAENMITITPQLALGLAKNTGDKEWIKATGQKMRADVYTSLYSHGLMTKLAGKEFKFKDGDQEKTGIMSFDDNSFEPRFELMGQSQIGQDTDKSKKDRESREKIAREKMQTQKDKAAGGTGASKMDPADKEFLKDYRSAKRNTTGMNDLMLQQLAKKDPKQAKDRQDDLNFVSKNEARYNNLLRLHPDESQKDQSAQKFSSADEVRQAYKAGQLTKDAAKKILAEQFGMK